MSERPEMVDWPVGIAICCQEWPVLLGLPLARCGKCKTQPQVVRSDGVVRIPNIG